MARTWLYADPHFFHDGVCRFTRDDGSKLRPWDDSTEMSEQMLLWYNEMVSPEDRVYILGDLAMNRRALDRSLPRLMGRKVLVKGNHDTDKLSYYSKYFDDIRSYVPKKGFILSHIPIHPNSMGRWEINFHGHLHYSQVGDPKYRCVSVEHTDYRPILLDDVLKDAGLK